WERAGYQVRGAASSGIAAEGSEGGSGIASRTLASMEYQWDQGRELLGPRDVSIIDEAGMIGTRQMERVPGEAERAGAKIVLVGDPEQLQAIEAGAAFRSLAERHGAAEISEVRRQHEDWQRQATRASATGRTGEAIHAYEQNGMVQAAETRDAARAESVDRWDTQRLAEPDQTRMILTHTNAEVRDSNSAARDRSRGTGESGEDVRISAERGAREFASGDRIMFFKNVAFAISAAVAVQSSVQPSVMAVLSSPATPETQGGVQGIASSTTGIAGVIAPMVSTWPMAWFTGPAAPVYFPGVPFSISAGFASIALVSSRRSPASVRA
ncbi:hypothetical protein OY671_007953, partial [Metschnikowia pulcherrima]